MKIKQQEYEMGELKTGEVFIYEDNFYIKTIFRYPDLPMGINLRNGKLVLFLNKTKITRCPNVELLIK